MKKQSLRTLTYEDLTAIRSVAVYRNVLKDPVVKLGLELIESTSDRDTFTGHRCAEFFGLLAEKTELSEDIIVGNAWQNYLLDLILLDDNAFSRKSELAQIENMGDSLLDLVKADLKSLGKLFLADFRNMVPSFPGLNGFKPLSTEILDSARASIKQILSDSRHWEEHIETLSAFYAQNGSGRFGCYRAFRWWKGSVNGTLIGIGSPDPIKLSDLVEYDWQRQDVRRNTEKLLAGLPVNNILLYGDRGTGKSSTVKAMLNEFPGSKLRLIEIAKEDLIDLPQILAILKSRTEKFILFVDDLSFEDNETGYKALKTVLEGGLEARPANVILYATSNRRNIIKEKFSDRFAQDDEVHPMDTMQEKLALADRFGIKVPFLAPDQEEYLRIVSALGSRAGIDITEDLRKKAVTWQHARSGRSARQFIDYVIGEMGLEPKS